MITLSMEQLVQKLKDGEMQALQVPYPHIGPNDVLVRNHFSLISIGTEGRRVKDARAGYLAKARSRSTEVKKVVKAAKVHGLRSTYSMVMNRLEAPSSLGYSCAGEVMAIGEKVEGVSIGDMVSCGGERAVHAEVVSVPAIMTAQVPEGLPMEQAAFTTVGAIALQGVRQADSKLGECCVVIGLGLVGLISCQLLQASGAKVIGIDIDESKIRKAKEMGIDAYLRSDAGLEGSIGQKTRGVGADVVIITAGSRSTDPIDLAGSLCRKKGKVVVVGDVSTDFERKSFYRKELDLIMSCSYGPGRYDRAYEEDGVDYPIAYVRWTEQRNMQAFIDLMADGRLDISGLISSTYDLKDAVKAYDEILDNGSNLTGVLLRYDISRIPEQNVQLRQEKYSETQLAVIGWIGAGSFATNFLLPNVSPAYELKSVCNHRSNSARNVAERFGFANCLSEPDHVLSDSSINTVFITGRHGSHGPLVIRALNEQKHVFVEKPLCLKKAELHEIIRAHSNSKTHLMVGFNRRFAPMVQQLREFIGEEKKSMSYRINAGRLAPDHWVNHPEQGGGRVIGELVHFIDLCSYIAGSPISSLSASGFESGSGMLDTVTVDLNFRNGSIASISYMSNGNAGMSKERLEVFSNGKVSVLDDFQTLELYGRKVQRIKGKQDKGHAREVSAFLSALAHGDEMPISFDECIHSTEATFAVLDSIKDRNSRQYFD